MAQNEQTGSDCCCLFGVFFKVLTNVMESEKQSTESERQPLHWRSCKLVIDPALTNGLYKVYRYDGQYFNLPVSTCPPLHIGDVSTCIISIIILMITRVFSARLRT